VTVRYVEPRSSNGATANGNGKSAPVEDAGVIARRQAAANGSGAPIGTRSNGTGRVATRPARVRRQDVAVAAARFPDGFTLVQIAGAVGCSSGAVKQHVVALVADGVLAKTSQTREHGAGVWKLRDGDSEAGAEDGGRAEPPGNANPGSAVAAGRWFPAVPVGSGRHETRNPVTALSEHSEPGEGLISLARA
jgi:hypothetical protein